MFYFYVVQSKKEPNWFYKGSTVDLASRIKQHNNGKVGSTRPYLPVRLVYYEAYLTEKAARRRESSVKKSGSVWTPLMKRIKDCLKDKQKP